MTEIFTLYSQTHDSLPEEHMRELAGDAELSIQQHEEGGRQFIFKWDDLTIRCNEMPEQKLPEHLQGFAGWVASIYDGNPDERGRNIQERIRHTRLVVGFVIEPERDEENRAMGILGAMCNGLTPHVFYGNAIYDQDSNLILAPDGSFSEDADVLGPVREMIADRTTVTLPESDGPSATPLQIERFERVMEQIRERSIPTLSYPLLIDDEEHTNVRSSEEVAHRVLVLWVVCLIANGESREDAISLLEVRNLWDWTSPEEREFLEEEQSDRDHAQKLLWRLECLQVLLWSLGEIDDLGWPEGMCDVGRIGEIMRARENDESFVTEAKLRPIGEILDAKQLILLCHWAIRETHVHNRAMPENLDWANPSKMLKVSMCPTTGVVAEWHHALNWLLCFDDADWDDVDTPT